MSPRRRWSIIALAAIGTGVAAFLPADSDRAAEIAAPADRAHAATVASRTSSTIELPKRRALRPQRGDIFAPHSPAPPAPPPQVHVQQEVVPQPPPNPYRFAGTVEYGGSRKVLLARGDRIFEVKEGEVLEPGFRVQAVTPQAVTLLYEPLDAPVTVALVFPDAPAAAGPTAPPAAQASANK